MPEPIPFPRKYPVPAPAPPSVQPPPAPPPSTRPPAPLWRKVLLILAFLATAICLVLFLLLRFPVHHTARLPTWPLHAGDVLTLTPGDANIAKWAQNPLSTGFVVQQLQPDGQPFATPTFCALEPDYMADAQQPGGTLTILNQQPTANWRVRWSGGNTVPPFIKKKGDFEAGCGTHAVLLMTPDQLHGLLDILAGVSTSAPGK
jgi:hypothetical protein